MLLPERLRIKKETHVFFYALITGIVSGLMAMVFTIVLEKTEIFVNSLHQFQLSESKSFLYKFDFISGAPLLSVAVVLIPAFGGLICGLIIFYFCKEAEGTGTDEMINAFHNKEGKINTKVPFFKSLATIFTLGSGGSGGKEGPISQIGAGIGVLIANLAGAGPRGRRTLMLSGTAAGLGAAFKTPLGGALTAVEMVYKKDIESDALIPCFISSVTAYLVFVSYAGTDPLILIREKESFHFSEIGFYLILGVLCYIFGFLFIKGFKDAGTFINKIKIPSWLKPALGGLLTGLITLFFFEISGTGHHYLQTVINGDLPDFFLKNGIIYTILALLIIAFLKIVATTLTIGSGGSAGIFGPSLFIGAMLGAAVGVTAKFTLQNPDVTVVTYIVVGMGAFYAGVANAPLAGIIMICEMTGSYALLPPVIIVSIFTFILSRQISFYKNQVDDRFSSPAHLWDMKRDVIERIIINDFFPEFRLLALINKNASFQEIREAANHYHSSDFIVVDENLTYQGSLSLRKVNLNQNENTAIENNALKLTDITVPSVKKTDSLGKVLNIIMQYDVDKVAVTDEENKTLGYIRSRDVFAAYAKQSKTGKS